MTNQRGVFLLTPDLYQVRKYLLLCKILYSKIFFRAGIFFFVLIALFFFCSATGTLGQTPAKRAVTCIIAADLHFGFTRNGSILPCLGDESGTRTLVMPSRKLSEDRCRHLSGDLAFDRARTEIIDLYCQRYECGVREKNPLSGLSRFWKS